MEKRCGREEKKKERKKEGRKEGKKEEIIENALAKTCLYLGI